MSSDSNHENPRFFSPGPRGITTEEILCVTYVTYVNICKVCQEKMEQFKLKSVFKWFISFGFFIDNNVIKEFYSFIVL